MGIQVIGTVQGLIVILGDLPSGGIHQGCVNLEQVGRLAHVLQPVVDDGRNHGTVGTVRLLLDKGRHDDDLLQAIGRIGEQRRNIRVVHNAVLEVGQQAAQGRIGILLHIELVGIREQVSLQAADAAQIFVVHKVELVEHMILADSSRAAASDTSFSASSWMICSTV